MSLNHLRCTGQLAAAIAVALSGAAVAEDVARPIDTLGEIVVTAQKREERLIDVPIAITAVTAAEIEARGITSLQDMQYSIPGLTMSEFGPGQGRLQLDGISTAGGATGLPTVGRYLDEMPITANGAGAELDLRLIDMERVEVLHGPQPTLYGEGSMGGTIHFVTASPDLTKFGGYVEGSWGSVTDGTDTYVAHAVLNAPLIDNLLGIRLVAGYERDGGWINSLATGDKAINGVDIKTLRVKVLYEPVSDLSVSLMYLHQEHNQAYQDFGGEDRSTVTLYPTVNDETYDLANLVIKYNLGAASLVSSTGYLHRNPTDGFDLSSYYAPLLASIGFPGITTVGYSTAGEQNMLSQELRLASNGQGPFNYVVGGYFRDYRTGALTDSSTAPGQLPFAVYDDNFNSTSKSWAEFAEVRYAFSDRLEGLLGLRHFVDEQSQNDSFSSFGASRLAINEGTFTSNNPRINIAYKLSPDALVYVNAAKGFRSGGFNEQPVGTNTIPASYGPESLWTYSVGTKQEWLDHRVSVDLSAYYNDYRDIQTVGVAPGGNANSYSSNTGKASGPGVNFSLIARPLQELTLSGTLGYTDMKYDTEGAVVNAGDPLDMVTKWTDSAAAGYRVPITDGRSLFARVDYQHTDGYQLTLRRTPFTAINTTGGRNVLNARFGVDFSKWQVYVFGNNLTDDNGALYPAVGTDPEPVLPTPRTIGVGFKAAL